MTDNEGAIDERHCRIEIAALGCRPVPVVLAEVVVRELTRYLGPHTAKNALRLFAQKSVRKAPDELGHADLEPLLAALRPMLRTLIGSRETDAVLADLRRELG